MHAMWRDPRHMGLYCSVCWRDHLHTEEKQKVIQRNLIEDVKECRLALNSSMQAIAEHEQLDNEGVLAFLAKHIDEEGAAVEIEDTDMDED